MCVTYDRVTLGRKCSNSFAPPIINILLLSGVISWFGHILRYLYYQPRQLIPPNKGQYPIAAKVPNTSPESNIKPIVLAAFKKVKLRIVYIDPAQQHHLT